MAINGHVEKSSFGALVSLLRYAKGHRTQILLATTCSILNRLFDVMPEILIGIAIDVVVNQESSFIASFGFTTPKSQIIVLGVLTFCIWAGESIFEYLLLILWRNLSQRLQAELRQDAYEHVQKQDMAFFEHRSSGELIAILNDDVNQLERFLDGGASDLIQTFVTVVVVGAVFFILSPLIALFAFTPIPVIIWGAFYFLRRATPLYADVRAQVGHIANRLSNNIGGIATIKSFTTEDREAASLAEASERYLQANRKAIAVSSAFIPIIRMAILAGFLCTFVIGGMQALNGDLNVGAYGVLVFLTQRLLWPLADLAKTIDLYERAMASTRRILTLLNTPIAIRDQGSTPLPKPLIASLEFDRVSFTYPSSGAGIRQISTQIDAGTTVAFVGATGSGKSTLVKLLLRFYEPDEGSILLGGIPIQDLKLEELRKTIALVSQDIYLFDGTIGENIAYSQADASHTEICQAAQDAEAMEFIDQLPHGMNTQIGERGIRLSGGQRQRISLARAILKNSPILVLDEATSAVDNETEAAIQRSLKRLSVDRTVIIIAHRLSTIVHSDHILVIASGQVTESGTHQSLINGNGEYSRQWGVQTGHVTQKPT